jgi:hypothetical protein
LASVAPFLCLIVAHFEWPDMYYLGGDFAWARAELRACATLRSYHVDERFEELVRAERSFGGWLLWIFWLVFFWRGAGGVLQGFLRILWCSVMVNRGEVVVDCVVNVASLRTYFGIQNVGQGLRVYFSGGGGPGVRSRTDNDKGKCGDPSLRSG